MTIDKGQKNTRLLIQPLHQPMSVEKQVAILYCGTKGLLRDIALDKVTDFQTRFLELLEMEHKDDVLQPLKQGVITDEITSILEKVASSVVAGLK